MKSKIVWVILSCSVVAALLLASCAPAAPTPAPVPTPAPTPTPKPTPVEKEVVTPLTKEPQYGGTLIAIYGSSEPQSWDPVDATWYTNPICSLFYEHLLIGDLQKGPRGTNDYSFQFADWVPEEYLKGQLAERWGWEDPLTLVYHLRKGVKFTGKRGVMEAREVTADDVVYCRKRYQADPRRVPSEFTDKDSFVVRDKYTYVVRYKKYYADWANSACGYYSQIYPPELVKAGIRDWKNAVGTGPFTLKDYVPASSVTYERNPDYWGTAVISGKEYRLPFVDRVEWPIIPDESTRLAALRTGKIDIVGVGWKYKETLEQTNPELARHDWTPISFAMMGLRMDNPSLPWYDKRVRRAMNMAIDRRGIIEALYKGYGVVLSSPYAIGWPKSLYTPLEELPESARELFEYNPQKAKQLLAEAGYPKGFKCQMDCGSDAASLDRNSMVVAYWKDVGIECELKPKEYGTLLSIMMGHKQTQILETGKYNGTPELILGILAKEGVWNAACFWPEEWKKKIDVALETRNVKERYPQLKKLNVELISEAPYIWLPSAKSFIYAQPWVKNYYGEYSVGAALCGSIYAEIWIDQDLKARLTGRK